MLPDPLKLLKIKLPDSPLDTLRDFIREGCEHIEKAGKDVRSIADELHGAFPHTLSTISTNDIKKQDIESQESTPDDAPISIMSQDIATACVPCAIGHFAGAAKLLNEAIRFRDEGIESNQVLDDIAGAIGEFNAMERVDLTPERLQKTPGWERAIAEDALRESRKFRHLLEDVKSILEIEKAAADAESFYKQINRRWYRGRFSKLGDAKAGAIAERVGED